MTFPIPDELISAYLDGELNADEKVRVEQAMRDSVELRRMHDELLALRTTMQSLPTADPADGLAERVFRQAERRLVLGLDEPHEPETFQEPDEPVVRQEPDGRSIGTLFRDWRVAVGAIATLAALVLVALWLPDRTGTEVAERTPRKPAASNDDDEALAESGFSGDLAQDADEERADPAIREMSEARPLPSEEAASELRTESLSDGDVQKRPESRVGNQPRRGQDGASAAGGMGGGGGFGGSSFKRRGIVPTAPTRPDEVPEPKSRFGRGSITSAIAKIKPETIEPLLEKLDRDKELLVQVSVPIRVVKPDKVKDSQRGRLSFEFEVLDDVLRGLGRKRPIPELDAVEVRRKFLATLPNVTVDENNRFCVEGTAGEIRTYLGNLSSQPNAVALNLPVDRTAASPTNGAPEPMRGGKNESYRLQRTLEGELGKESVDLPAAGAVPSGSTKTPERQSGEQIVTHPRDVVPKGAGIKLPHKGALDGKRTPQKPVPEKGGEAGRQSLMAIDPSTPTALGVLAADSEAADTRMVQILFRLKPELADAAEESEDD